MRKWQLILAACVLALAGCAHFEKESCRQCALEGFDPRVVRPPNPLLPNVFVVGSKFLVVDQEPIRISGRDFGLDGRITISWALPAGSPYTFSTKEKKGPDGIAFSPADRARRIDVPAGLECGVRGAQEKVYECSFRSAQRPAVYKYTINVRHGDRLLEALDPHVFEY